MTDKFKKCIPIILKHEGGYVNHPDDPGGATNYGISLRFLKAQGYTMTGELIGDIDKDGDVDIDDIKKMTEDEAVLLYFTYFWKSVYELMEDELALNVFDFGVNAGTFTAAKLLQQVVGAVPDGIIGGKTLKAVKEYRGNLIFAYKKRRETFYYNLCAQNPRYEKFIKGWIKRVEECTFNA